MLLLFRCWVMFDSFATPWTVAHQAPLSMRIPWILQPRILEWIAISSSRGSSWPRDRTLVSCIGRSILYLWATREAHSSQYCKAKDREETGRMRGREESTRGQKEKKSLFIPITNNSYQLFYFWAVCQSRYMHEPNRQLRHIVNNVMCITCRKGENKASDLFVLGNRGG